MFWITLTVFVGLAGFLFYLSYILGIIFIILVAASLLSIKFADPVINAAMSVRLREGCTIKRGVLREHIDVPLCAEENYRKSISFDELLENGYIVINTPDGEVTYQCRTNIEIKAEKIFWTCRYSFDNQHITNVSKYFTLQPYHIFSKNNKVKVAFFTIAAIAAAAGSCFYFSRQYEKYNRHIQDNLNANINSIVSDLDGGIELTEYQETGEKVYYSELPEVNLIVITKDRNIFVDEGSRFFNPETVNTVIMFYEDNLSGRLYEESETKESETEENSGDNDITYYDLTELYLNIPVVTDDKERHTLGEMFQGSLGYNNQTGYDAVKSWFRDIYHINISSVTEIPESVFSGCFGSENSMSVNLNLDFVRFMYYNYCSSQENIYSSFSINEMLAESMPYFSENLRKHAEELNIRLGVKSEQGLNTSAMLRLNGEAITSFGNSVRMSGESEYTYLRDMGYYNNQSDFPVTEWENHKLGSIVHSNWDIVLADLLESISDMNNGTYQMLCSENHADILSLIQSSLSPDELRSFITSLCRANDILGDEAEPEKQFVFYVRNLNLNVSTVLGSPNIYILNEPVNITPYTNRQIKKSLYYCLKKEKEMPDVQSMGKE